MIDDNPLEHFIMQKMLSRYDLFKDADHYHDARDVIKLLKKKRGLPDLIFLDLNMPCLSGFDFLTQFEVLYPSFKNPISIYIFSSSVSKTDKSRALSYPFVKGFYSKPMKRENLESLYMVYQNTNRIAG
ncbi:MAG: response regulator [Mucilaginibacter sp.]